MKVGVNVRACMIECFRKLKTKSQIIHHNIISAILNIIIYANSLCVQIP